MRIRILIYLYISLKSLSKFQILLHSFCDKVWRLAHAELVSQPLLLCQIYLLIRYDFVDWLRTLHLFSKCFRFAFSRTSICNHKFSFLLLILGPLLSLNLIVEQINLTILSHQLHPMSPGFRPCQGLGPNGGS